MISLILRFLGACLMLTWPLHLKPNLIQELVKEGIFLGYKPGTKGFIILNLKTRELIVSRNVTFHESIFPLIQTNPNSNSPIFFPFPVIVASNLAAYDDVLPPQPLQPPSQTHPAHFTHPTQTAPSTQPNTTLQPLPQIHPDPPIDPPHHQDSTGHLHFPPPHEEQRRRSSRPRKAPSYLQGYHCNLAGTSATTNSLTSITYPIESYLSYHTLSPS